MGVMSGITQMLADLGDFFALFSSFFDALPTVCKLLIYFVFGGIVLMGLLNMILRST
ncbi:MAG: hypothetical protein IKB93_01705 [Clostridia bacterium]|nr:hypothetical protein [Clostridia bacterium]